MKYVITSVIDADDAWHRDFILKTNDILGAPLPQLREEEETRGVHVRHSAGAAVTFPVGLEWFVSNDALRPMDVSFSARLFQSLLVSQAEFQRSQVVTLRGRPTVAF